MADQITNNPSSNGKSCDKPARGLKNAKPHRPDRLHMSAKPDILHGLIFLDDISLALPTEDIDNISIHDEEHVSSYNTTGDLEIAVPGSPALLVPIHETVQLARDSENEGLRVFPHYHHRFGPLVRAVRSADPDFDFSAVDLITVSGVLVLLYCYLGDRPPREPHRFDIEWWENALVLSRWPGLREAGASRGWGKSFELETLRYPDELCDSASHHCVRTLRMGVLRLLVEAEIDGYYDDQPSPCPESIPPSNLSANAFHVLETEHLEGEEEKEEDGADEQERRPSSEPIVIRNVGSHDISRSRLVEVKTRAKNRRYQYDVQADSIPQLYFSGVDQLYLSRHRSGRFDPTDAQFVDMAKAIKMWEREQQCTLRKEVACLRELKRVTWDAALSGFPRTALICSSHGGKPEMKLYERTGAALWPEAESVCSVVSAGDV